MYPAQLTRGPRQKATVTSANETEKLRRWQCTPKTARQLCGDFPGAAICSLFHEASSKSTEVCSHPGVG